MFSATLTRDPGKLASLGLRDPKYFVVQNQTEGGSDDTPLHFLSERFAMPSTLTVSLGLARHLFWVNLCRLGAYGCQRTVSKAAHAATSPPQSQCSQCISFYQVVGVHDSPCLPAGVL